MVQVINRPRTSEAHLVGSAIAGDGAAYAELYKIHYDSTLTKVTAEFHLDDPDKARDIVQQAFLDVLDNRRDIDRTIPFAESIMEAARDRAISRDHDDSEKLRDFISMAESALNKTSAADADPADILAAREKTQGGLAALQALFAMDKAADNKLGAGIRYLFEVHQKGLTTAEIATREHKPVKTIEQSIQKACLALRPVLAPFLS